MFKTFVSLLSGHASYIKNLKGAYILMIKVP
jgi:hypothetical protein